jgi:hypothetical protein
VAPAFGAVGNILPGDVGLNSTSGSGAISTIVSYFSRSPNNRRLSGVMTVNIAGALFST